MAEGSFVTPYYTPPEGSKYTRRIKVGWRSTNNAANNTSTITWDCVVDATSTNNNLFIIGGPIYVSINGTRVLSLTGQRKLEGALKLGSGSISVPHGSDGKKTVAVSIEAAIYYNAINNTYYGNIGMTPNPVYNLTTSAGTGSTISVSRVSSPAGGTGAISAGTNVLYHGDVIKVTFGANDHYVVAGRTVNGSTFTSGNNHTVSGNVAVASSANPNPPYTLSISAGTGTTITVNRTSSPIGGTGNLSAGKNLFPGDRLTITIAAKTHYKVVTRTVNGSTFTSGNNHTVAGNVSVVATGAVNPIYSLNISAGAGSSITVNRTSSPVGSTGIMTAGANKLFNGDVLKISFSPSTNYRLLTTTVNGSNFSSGGNRTVSGDISVASTAQILASAVGGTAADIESTSTITVTRYSNNYYHSLHYKFGSLSGYITSTGGLSSTEQKYQAQSVPFYIPSSFYYQIPNSKTGTCTITCRTYETASSTSVLGTPTTANITLTAFVFPELYGEVIDVNPVTAALTGDQLKLVKHASTARATLTSSGVHGSTIVSNKIKGVEATVRDFPKTEEWSYAFATVDSRGRENLTAVYPTMIDYIPLTLWAYGSRPMATGDKLIMYAGGSYFNGSFGAHSNSLSVSYRYVADSDHVMSSWREVPFYEIVRGSDSFNIPSFELPESFDYREGYRFEVMASDGASGYLLNTETSSFNVTAGIPIFDWGKHDVKFNVGVTLPMTTNINNMYLHHLIRNEEYDFIPESGVTVVHNVSGEKGLMQVISLKLGGVSLPAGVSKKVGSISSAWWRGMEAPLIVQAEGQATALSGWLMPNGDVFVSSPVAMDPLYIRILGVGMRHFPAGGGVG